MQKRKTYTRDFKIEAVRLLEQSDKPVVEIARELCFTVIKGALLSRESLSTDIPQ